mmetsp:Transcript_123081/g.353600  ORF Transcript_123081/g.353600 Transcript_123081/m.353600 type:complete len:215 (+) Transcript_123081:1030-1674(+)
MGLAMSYWPGPGGTRSAATSDTCFRADLEENWYVLTASPSSTDRASASAKPLISYAPGPGASLGGSKLLMLAGPSNMERWIRDRWKAVLRWDLAMTDVRASYSPGPTVSPRSPVWRTKTLVTSSISCASAIWRGSSFDAGIDGTVRSATSRTGFTGPHKSFCCRRGLSPVIYVPGPGFFSMVEEVYTVEPGALGPRRGAFDLKDAAQQLGTSPL